MALADINILSSALLGLVFAWCSFLLSFYILQVSFNPQDNTQVCVTGNGMFKLLRFAEGTLKQTNFQRGEPQNYLAHTWVSEDKIIVGTDTGRLFLFESGDQRWETSIMVKEPTSETRNLEVIRESER